MHSHINQSCKPVYGFIGTFQERQPHGFPVSGLYPAVIVCQLHAAHSICWHNVEAERLEAQHKKMLVLSMIHDTVVGPAVARVHMFWWFHVWPMMTNDQAPNVDERPTTNHHGRRQRRRRLCGAGALCTSSIVHPSDCHGASSCWQQMFATPIHCN